MQCIWGNFVLPFPHLVFLPFLLYIYINFLTKMYNQLSVYYHHIPFDFYYLSSLTNVCWHSSVKCDGNDLQSLHCCWVKVAHVAENFDF